MKRILRYAIGYVAMLTGMVLGLFGIGLSVVGLAFWQMQRASIASGFPAGCDTHRLRCSDRCCGHCSVLLGVGSPSNRNASGQRSSSTHPSFQTGTKVSRRHGGRGGTLGAWRSRLKRAVLWSNRGSTSRNWHSGVLH